MVVSCSTVRRTLAVAFTTMSSLMPTLAFIFTPLLIPIFLRTTSLIIPALLTSVWIVMSGRILWTRIIIIQTRGHYFATRGAILTLLTGTLGPAGTVDRLTRTHSLLVLATDYHLQNTSPCIGAGVYVFLTQDFLGDPVSSSSVDIGAVQSQAVIQPPPPPPPPAPSYSISPTS